MTIPTYMKTIFHLKDGSIFEKNTSPLYPPKWPPRNSIIHNESGPAIIFTNLETGEIIRQSYLVNNKFHRVDGPAEWWFDEIKIDYVKYFFNGKAMQEKIYNKILNSKTKSCLIEFLLDSNQTIREFAGYKLNLLDID